MPDPNRAILDAAVKRRIALERYSSSQVKQALQFLKEVERDLIGRIAVIRSEATTRSGRILLAQQEQLLKSVQSVYAEAYARLTGELTGNMRTLAGIEADHASGMLSRAVDSSGANVAITTQTLTATEAFEIAAARPMNGAVLKDWLADLEPSHRRRVEQALKISFTEGENLNAAVSRLRGATALNQRGLETLIRTSTTHIAAAVNEATYKANTDVIQEVEWVSVLDGRTTDVCRARDGNRYPVGEGPRPPAHPGCLSGDALVSSGSRVTGATKRWYNGDLIVVRTSAGKQLACTPNHPILTDAGWIAARLLQVGGHVVCNLGIDRVPPFVDAQDQDIEARIEDAAEAIFRSEKMSAVPVPTAAEDFHGDGMENDIAIVAVNRDLCLDVQPSRLQGAGKFDLVFRHMRLALLSSASRTLERINAVGNAALRLVSGFGQPLSLAGGGGLHSGRLLLAAVPKLKPGISQDARNRARAGGHSPRNTYDTRSGLVELDDLGRVQVGAAHGRRDDIDTGRHKRSSSSGVHDAIVARDILDGSAGPVALDQVVSVGSEWFAGHVFNLETDGGWYIANGIVTHNCRSTTISVLKEFEPPPRENYGEWLRRQDAATQDDILGPARGRLLRAGKLTVDRFVDMKGKALTLDELGATRAGVTLGQSATDLFSQAATGDISHAAFKKALAKHVEVTGKVKRLSMPAQERLSKVKLGGVDVWLPADLSVTPATVRDLNKVLNSADDAANELKTATKRVTLAKARSADDGFWADQFGHEGFETAAAAMNGDVVFFGGRRVTASTLTHEMGHNWAEKLYGSSEIPSTSPFARLVASGVEPPPTWYAGYNLDEDWAETISLFVTNPAKLQSVAPKRFAVVSSLLKR